MDLRTRKFVRERAGDRYEYCHLPQTATLVISFHVEHVIARQHLEDDSDDNLALACDRCNFLKGPNLSSIDPMSGEVVQLYHPRHQLWTEHFALEGPRVFGLTPTGRATVRLLEMNAAPRVQLRQMLVDEGFVI